VPAAQEKYKLNFDNTNVDTYNGMSNAINHCLSFCKQSLIKAHVDYKTGRLPKARKVVVDVIDEAVLYENELYKAFENTKNKNKTLPAYYGLDDATSRYKKMFTVFQELISLTYTLKQIERRPDIYKTTTPDFERIIEKIKTYTI
jgi:hypothetical protein